jgi:hypothetical protein
MDTRLDEIYDNTIPHSSFLSEKAIKSCMYQSYRLGIDDVLEWLKKNDHLTDNISYLIQEFENQNNSR